MNDINLIRNKLGLTQVKLAEYLGISRSSVNMFERSERPIPTPVLLKLAELQIKLSKSIIDDGEIKDHKALPGPPLQKKQTVEFKGIIHNKYTMKINKLYQKLTKMKEQYKILEQNRNIIESLLKDHGDIVPDIKYWQMQLLHVLIRTENCKPEIQEKLAMKISMLSKEIKNLRYDTQ